MTSMTDIFNAKDLEDLEGFEIDDDFLGRPTATLPPLSEVKWSDSPLPPVNPVADLVATAEAALGLAKTETDSLAPIPLTPGPFGGLEPRMEPEFSALPGDPFEETIEVMSPPRPTEAEAPAPLLTTVFPEDPIVPAEPSVTVEAEVVSAHNLPDEGLVSSLPLATLTEAMPSVSNNGREVQIPRITVHVFADRQDTLASAERAGQDRRMSRATTQIRVGGIPAAISAYQLENTPPLIIVECMKDARSLLDEVDQLAEVCDSGTKVIIIGATNDIQLYRELIRRGVSEYLVAPVQPLQLISAIDGLFADPAQPFVGRSIAFVGARGGAGASSVAHNTAYAMSERIGVNTVIVDYDLPFGTAGLDFNQDPISGVADALGQPDRLDATLLDRMMARCTDKLSLFAAPATLDGDWDIRPEAFEEVTSRIRSTAPFVVLDLPHLWSTWMRKTLIAADEVVVVATPDLASLRNAKNMIDLIKHGRPNDAPPRLVLNQVGMPGRPEIPTKDFGAALGIHPSLIIPFDAKTFGAAANNGQMILDAAAKSRSAEAFETLAQIVSCRELPTAAARPAPAKGGSAGSLLSSLFSKKH